MSRHKTKYISVGKCEELIDSKIANIIEYLWIKNIKTIESCEDNMHGYSWILFPSSSAPKFFESICSGPKPIKHAYNCAPGLPTANSENPWHMAAFFDYNYFGPDIYIHVWFKQDFIQRIEKNLKPYFPSQNLSYR